MISSFRSHQSLWPWVIKASLLAAFSANLCTLVYKLDIHSDILFMNTLFDDLFKHHGQWNSWRFSPAPSYFPDLLLYALAYGILESVPWQILFVTVSQILLLTVAALWVLHELYARASYASRLTVFCIVGFAVIVANHTTTAIGLFFNANNIQVPTLISSLLILGLYLRLINSAATKKPGSKLLWLMWALTVVLGGIAQASSAVFVLNFALPFCMVLALCWYRCRLQKNEPIRQWSHRAAASLLLSQALGMALTYGLTYNAPLNGRIGLRLQAIKDSVHALRKATGYLMSPENVWSFSAFWIFGGLLFIALFHTAKQTRIKIGASTVEVLAETRVLEASTPAQKLTAHFLWATTIVTVTGAVVSGGFADIYSYRYFMVFIALGAIVSAGVINTWPASTQRHYSLGCGLLFLSLSFVSVSAILSRPDKRTLHEISMWGAIFHPEQSIASCLKTLENQGVGLHAGVADFWAARGVRYYARQLQNNSSPFILATLHDLSPFYWITTAAPMLNPVAYKAQHYNFVILRIKESPGPFQYDRTSMESILPKGFVAHACPDGQAEILVYPTDALTLALQPKLKLFIAEIFPVRTATP